ncbi:hypothetical protein [Pedobacter nototheniae]|uniref:hypothetical protein n=1 Tax=Pedobacter nototheniae TaxID=2488994 RepID=UPI00292E7964|nr:hypothetical protein [Pedobacter nototheniae]
MNLTKIQLNKIRIYLEEIGFKYIDVQMEILDHVASAVEEKMTENPALTFQDAVNQTQTSFGKAGFTKIEKSIIKGLGKKYWKLFLRHFCSFFHISSLWIVILSGFGLYQLQNLIANQDNFFTVFIIAIIILFSALAYRGFKAVGYKKFMVYKISGSYAAYVGIFLMFVFQAINKPSTGMLFGLNKSYLVVSVLITFFGLYYSAALKTVKAGALESKAIADKLKLLYH